MNSLAVIVCTHNPRLDYLDRTLAGLAAQSLDKDQWELVLVDNASQPGVLPPAVPGLPAARLLREEELGLIKARLCGIRKSDADLLVFVDDDNVLAADYLDNALRIAEEFPMLGVWGGQCLPEFEVPPPEWTKPYWQYLALREVKRDTWGNTGSFQFLPVGAGMCVRRTVSQYYLNAAEHDPRRKSLGRKGKLLFGSEDIDIALSACDLGMGTGLFSRLKLTHLIPPDRLRTDYLLRLAEDLHYSSIVRQSLRPTHHSTPSRIERLVGWYKYWRMAPAERALQRAIHRGQARARQNLARSPLPPE